MCVVHPHAHAIRQPCNGKSNSSNSVEQRGPLAVAAPDLEVEAAYAPVLVEQVLDLALTDVLRTHTARQPGQKHPNGYGNAVPVHTMRRSLEVTRPAHTWMS